MNFTQYLLVKFAEEASEVAKEALKETTFGVNSNHKGDVAILSLDMELIDQMGVLGLLVQRPDVAPLAATHGLFAFEPTNERCKELLHKKQCKVCHFALYSYADGHLTLTKEELDYVTMMGRQYKQFR